jgi:phosphoribosylformylglycinamidine synthase I
MLAKPAFGRLRVGVVQFPGSNCDDDCVDVLRRHYEIDASKIWHQETGLPKLDALILPGGFSFGDYLRSGALAARAPIMESIKSFAARGGHILGICNGFQILTESGLLPGALLHNKGQKFICTHVKIKSTEGPTLKIPIAHAEGRFWIDEEGLRRLDDLDLVAYRYCADDGRVSVDANPNGSVANIAGIYSKDKKILGMMPHPERATDMLMGGSCDGMIVINNFLQRI